MTDSTYKLTSADLIAAQQLHFRADLKRNVLKIMVAITFLLIALSLAFTGGLDFQMFKFALPSVALLLGVMFFMAWFMIPIHARRAFKQSEKIWIENRVHWDPSGIQITSERGQGQFAWDDFYRWAADSRSLLLYQDARVFYPFPLRAFPTGAAEQIAGFLDAAGVKRR